jgi:PI-3-kinase-related kinase SMG-1
MLNYHILFLWQTENSDLLTSIEGIKRHFLQLLDGGGCQELTPGQMLLMGFNGLFTRLDDEFNTLLECMDMMIVPDIWKKVDVIREAKSLQVL